ncbi:MAG TPA: hypothetical protein VK035_05080 [Kiloniellales bacterium]|nr:hypothetical protein [Kiloniellales bacterium]
MQRNTLILRLTVVAGAIVVAAVLLMGLMMSYGTAPAVPEAEILSPAEVEARLAEAGHEVESLQREGGIYQVRFVDGRLLWLDAETAAEIEVPQRRGNALQNSEVVRLLREAGYQDIAAPVWRRGAFEAEATDEAGRRWRLRLDTYSGEVLEREAL